MIELEKNTRLEPYVAPESFVLPEPIVWALCETTNEDFGDPIFI